MKKKTIQPRIGKDGKHPSIFKKEKRSTGKISDPAEMEEFFRELAANPTRGLLETINGYEEHALAIIEKYGHHFNKPYNFFDVYKHDRGEYLLTAKVKAEIGGDAWDMTPAGRAAQILKHCQHLKSSMEGGNIENTAHHAMLLQQEVDHLKFKQWDLPAREGERLINIGRKLGNLRKGLKKEFTNFLDTVIGYAAGRDPDFKVKDVENSMREFKNGEFEVESFKEVTNKGKLEFHLTIYDLNAKKKLIEVLPKKTLQNRISEFKQGFFPR